MRVKTLDVLIAVGFVMAYVILDRLSFVHPVAGVGITPWNPQVGLAVAFVLHLGKRASIPVLLAPICADLLTRSAHIQPALSIAISFSSGTIYLLCWTAMRRRVFCDHFSVKRLRDLVALFAMSSISAALVSICSVLWYTAHGLIPEGQVGAAILSQWIGDWIGIAIAVPLIFQLLDWKSLPRVSAGMLVHFGMLLVALVFVLGGGQQMRTSFFYLLFLPVVAVAAGYGFEAVVVALGLVQLFIIGADKLFALSLQEVTNLQAFLLVLSATGMAAGLLVLQRKQAEALLWQQQDLQSDLQRRGSLSELATLIAHEINQPLTAARTYSRLMRETISQEMPGSTLENLAFKSEAQVHRASDVLRKLRNLVRLRESEQKPCSVEEILRESVTLVLQTLMAERHDQVNVSIADGLPLVVADKTQIEQVVINLLQNALDAIAAVPTGGLVRVSAARISEVEVEIIISDNGPGFAGEPSEIIDNLRSTKREGLGVGLSLSRTITQLHGGALDISGTNGGATARFKLKVA